MEDFNNEEDVKRLLKSACKPVVPPPEFKKHLFEYLMSETGSAALSAPRSKWGRPKVLVPIVAAIICAATGYGIWLSLNLPSP